MEVPSIDRFDPAVAESLGYLNRTPCFTSRSSPFSYFLYVPPNYHDLERLNLMVLIHQSSRNASEIRDEGFTFFARKHSYIILAPLFPIEPDDPQDRNGYKQLVSGDTRYDKIVLAMVEEVKARYNRVDIDRFLLWGFSGGGQYVHRFAYLYPERLKAIAIGAPGSQTLPDTSKPYPNGVSDLESVFGLAIQWERLCPIPAMFIVGDCDTDTFYATARGRPLSPSVENGRYGGVVRLEENWRHNGAKCHLQVVPGATHEEDKMVPYVVEFFEKCLQGSI
ncbi:hypothetical protein N7468_007891 [Penicillium chermesinum]|uniref:Uncharacterized protein n=1 Tax=Penicillium chermesinum TaxID=63820 RepID=A0A9W9NNQ7_9EURO|nr:uncharacterized protein N7468_007891 [Penicillium chermesinum]KAJ5223349.1 hypothetical protein N7468_007891 [Penicillium chermesinum]KAJ6155812.1 hypothetical protein N7470_006378 [Penicillium chermesinum]